MKLDLIRRVDPTVSNGLKVISITDNKALLVGLMHTVIPENGSVILNTGFRIEPTGKEVVMIMPTDDAHEKGIYFPQDVVLPGEKKHLELKLHAMGDQQVMFGQDFPVAKVICVNQSVLEKVSEDSGSNVSGEEFQENEKESIENVALDLFENMNLQSKNKTELVDIGGTIGLVLDVNDKKDTLVEKIDTAVSEILGKV